LKIAPSIIDTNTTRLQPIVAPHVAWHRRARYGPA
jgi:hypothetical protein